MNESIILEPEGMVSASVFEREAIHRKNKTVLFIPDHKFFNEDLANSPKENRHVFYPAIILPFQQTGYIKAKYYEYL